MKLDEINQNIRQKMFYKQKKYEEMEKEKMKWEKQSKSHVGTVIETWVL